MTLLNETRHRITDANNTPYSGGKLFTYETGTTTQVTSYQNSDFSTSHANPVVADANGKFPSVYLKNGDYKLVYKTDDDLLVDTVDDYKAFTASAYHIPDELSGVDRDAIIYDLDKSGTPVVSQEDVTLKLDPSTEQVEDTNTARFDVIDTALNWLGSATCPTTYLELADGTYGIAGVRTEKYGRDVYIKARDDDGSIEITKVEFGAQVELYLDEQGTGPIYRQFPVTITLKSALPAHFIVGCPVGVLNPQLNNDGNRIGGGGTLTWIAPNKLSCTFNIRAGNRAIDPTISNQPLADIQLVDPIININDTIKTYLRYNNVCLIADASGWNGSADEGIFNVWEGTHLTLDGIGLAYKGYADTEHDLIFARDQAHVTIKNYSVISGAGDRPVRLFSGASLFVDQSCLSDGGIAEEVIGAQNGCNVTISASDIQGGNRFGLNMLHFCQLDISGYGIWNSANGIMAGGQSSTIEMGNGEIGFCEVAVNALEGEVSFISGNNTLKNCDLGLKFRNGTVLQAPTFENNVTDSDVGRNALSVRGGWFADLTKPIHHSVDAGAGVADNTVKVIILDGDNAAGAGFVEIIANAGPTPGHYASLSVSRYSRTASTIALGGNTVAGDTGTSTTGKTTVEVKTKSVMVNGVATDFAALYIRNDTGGSMFYEVFYKADLGERLA